MQILGSNESKKDVAIMSAGIISYLADKNGDYVGAVYDKDNNINYYNFKSGLYNIERILSTYEKDVDNTNTSNINNVLNNICNHIKKKMIIFVVTDLSGIKNIEESTLKKVSTLHDILFIDINDTYMTGDKAYDIEKNKYVPKLLFKDTKLHELEVKAKEQLTEECTKKLGKYGIQSVTIDSNKECIIKIINLLERHRYANIS